MQPSLLYIPYAAKSYEQTGYIITFAHFEAGNLLESKRNIEEYEYILDSIDESYTDNDYYDRSIITNFLQDIPDGIQIHPELNARDSRFKYVTALNKRKMNGKEQNSQRRLW